MARRKISLEYRQKLSEKLMDLGNLSIGVLALGQLVNSKEFSLIVFATGVIFAIFCYIISYIVGS